MMNLFTAEEMLKHRAVEQECLVIARKNPNPLYDFWRAKRNILIRRAFDNYVESDQK